jgi:hypothetical protein
MSEAPPAAARPRAGATASAPDDDDDDATTTTTTTATMNRRRGYARNRVPVIGGRPVKTRTSGMRKLHEPAGAGVWVAIFGSALLFAGIQAFIRWKWADELG